MHLLIVLSRHVSLKYRLTSGGCHLGLRVVATLSSLLCIWVNVEGNTRGNIHHASTILLLIWPVTGVATSLFIRVVGFKYLTWVVVLGHFLLGFKSFLWLVCYSLPERLRAPYPKSRDWTLPRHLGQLLSRSNYCYWLLGFLLQCSHLLSPYSLDF